METCQPLLEAPVVGIDVLHVDGALGTDPNAFAGADIDGLVRNTVDTGEGRIGCVGVGHQQHLRVESWQ